MTELQKPGRTSRAVAAVFGLTAAGAGLYFALVGLDLLPPPSRQNAPGWIVVACGLVFLLGGLMVLGQVAGKANANGEVPAVAPLWATSLQRAADLIIIGCFATIATWIALFGHPGKFSLGGEVTRVAFGLGALIMWLYFLALVRRTVRMVFGRSRQP